MFLSKKNAVYFNKPKNIDPNRVRRVLAGWQDDEEEKKQQYDFRESVDKKQQQPSNLLLGQDYTDMTTEKAEKKELRQKFYMTWDELDERSDIQCEKRLVEDIVQPGGIRIKPNDSMLNDFLKETKGMEVYIIGSLLLSKLEANYPYQTKAKALYTIEFLLKKNEKYLSYFKAQIDKIRQFPEPEDNVQSYRKILKTLLNFIGISSPAPVEQELKPVFVDPGYNDEPKSSIGSFIQSNNSKSKKTEVKKVIIGPGQQKQKVPTQKTTSSTANNDFMSLDLLGTSSNSTSQNKNTAQKQLNLLQGAFVANKSNGIDLIYGSNQKTSSNNVNLIF